MFRNQSGTMTYNYIFEFIWRNPSIPHLIDFWNVDVNKNFLRIDENTNMVKNDLNFHYIEMNDRIRCLLGVNKNKNEGIIFR
ncbi:MAG: hypothetical protein Ta2E_01490 [Mycoplasmoidaceae bacterium]|nr:MAG: hypothetical protein Ta2E_01490 [Mycoplasmoidaceae bacterium]